MEMAALACERLKFIETYYDKSAKVRDIELYCNRCFKKDLEVVFCLKDSWVLYIEILSSVIRGFTPRINANAGNMSSIHKFTCTNFDEPHNQQRSVSNYFSNMR